MTKNKFPVIEDKKDKSNKDFCEECQYKNMVILSCTKEYYNANDVEFIDIEEDISGRDVMTFKCPKCGQTHRSLVFGG